ncbi:MAG: Holliday junction resolvase RuvX [Acidimicrobiia bacterium]|nr:Holliday junction resolvase RuvX [Acidimicrobiia bacterium]
MTNRIIGLDPGERRIGVSVSDPTGTIASPERYIDTKVDDVDQTLVELCETTGATKIVVGLPVNLDGSEGPSAQRARVFAAHVRDVTGVDVEFHDERFTSHTAESALIAGGVKRRARKEKRDQVAAAVMLQSYLDRQSYDTDRT